MTKHQKCSLLSEYSHLIILLKPLIIVHLDVLDSVVMVTSFVSCTYLHTLLRLTGITNDM